MLTHTQSLMQQAIVAECFPGAVLLVAQDEKVAHFEAYGWANRFNRTPMALDTVFDLASLTKPLATTLALMVLMQDKTVEIDQPLSIILPRFKHTPKAGLCIRDLLTHQAGLPAWRPYFRALIKYPPQQRLEVLKQHLVKEPLIHVPGEIYLYSDLGFMILAWIIEEITQMPMGHYISKMIYQPLGLDASLYFPSLSHFTKKNSCAATELCAWRGILLNGQVHDDNAFTTAGLQGHAGLFGTVEAVFALLQNLMNTFDYLAQGPFAPDLVRLFLSPHGKHSRPLGFDVPSGDHPSCGRFFSDQTIGHLGFTGTSFWMDLKQKIVVVLCTNRIHPSRFNRQIRAWRPRLHDTVMTELKYLSQ